MREFRSCLLLLLHASHRRGSPSHALADAIEVLSLTLVYNTPPSVPLSPLSPRTRQPRTNHIPKPPSSIPSRASGGTYALPNCFVQFFGPTSSLIGEPNLRIPALHVVAQKLGREIPVTRGRVCCLCICSVHPRAHLELATLVARLQWDVEHF